MKYYTFLDNFLVFIFISVGRYFNYVKNKYNDLFLYRKFILLTCDCIKFNLLIELGIFDGVVNAFPEMTDGAADVYWNEVSWSRSEIIVS